MSFLRILGFKERVGAVEQTLFEQSGSWDKQKLPKPWETKHQKTTAPHVWDFGVLGWFMGPAVLGLFGLSILFVCDLHWFDFKQLVVTCSGFLRALMYDTTGTGWYPVSHLTSDPQTKVHRISLESHVLRTVQRFQQVQCHPPCRGLRWSC